MTQPRSASLTKRSNKDDVEALLSDLDSLGTNVDKNNDAHATRAKADVDKDEAQTLLADLDDLVKQRRAPTPKRASSSSNAAASHAQHDSPKPSAPDPGDQNPTPIPSDTLAVDGGISSTLASASSVPLEQADAAPTTNAPWSGWWSSATKLADQARAELEKRAAQVADATNLDPPPTSGSSKVGAPWTLAQNVNSFIKAHGGDLNKIRSDIGKVGMKGWNEILNVVVPPIENHEVLNITLSHDMVGFDGVPDVVFQVLQRVMETHAASQNAEQQLVVNSAPGQHHSSESSASQHDVQQKTDMNPVQGFKRGWELAETKLNALIAASQKPPSADTKPDSISLPITKCPLFIRIQPVLESLPGLPAGDANQDTDPTQYSHIYIEILLRDTANDLTHRTVSQPIPVKYATLSFENNPWAEDLLSDSLQAALGSVGLDYVRSRMQARSDALSQAAAKVSE